MPRPLCLPMGCSALQSLFLVPFPSREAHCMTFQTLPFQRKGWNPTHERQWIGVLSLEPSSQWAEGKGKFMHRL